MPEKPANAPAAPTFEEALDEGKRVGMRTCSDPALMAHFCTYNLPYVVGAVSPQLVWEGARKRGLTCRQLVHLAATDVMAVSDLQWL